MKQRHMSCLLDRRCQLKQDVHLDYKIYFPSPCIHAVDMGTPLQ